MRILLALIVLLASGAGLYLLFDEPVQAAPKLPVATVADQESSQVEAREGDTGRETAQVSRMQAEEVEAEPAQLETDPSPGKGDYTVSGRVIDTSGAPVAGAEVAMLNSMSFGGSQTILLGGDLNRIRSRSAPRVETDSAGRFTLFRDKPGKFTLSATHPDHPRAQTEAELAEGATQVADLIVTLPRGATVGGTVLGVPADAELIVAARKRGPINPVPVAQEENSVRTVSVAFDEVISGAGLKIPPGDRHVEVQIDGTFEIRGLDPESKAELRVYELVNERYVPRSDPLEVVPPLGSATLRYQAGATVTARLVDASTGEPIRNAKIRAGANRMMKVGDMEVPMGRLRSRPETPNEDGVLEIAGLEAGKNKGKSSFAVEFAVDGYLTQKIEDIDLQAGNVTDLGTLRFELAPLVALRVVDSVSGQPIEGATVRLGGGGQTFTSSDGGNFVVATQAIEIGSDGVVGKGVERSKTRETLETDDEGLAETSAQPGMLSYEIKADDYGPLKGEIEIAPSGRSEQTVELSKAAQLIVTVVDARGVPLEGSSIRLESEDLGFRGESTDADGRAVFEGLPAGDIRVALRGKAQASGGSSFSFRISSNNGGVSLGDSDLLVETVSLASGEIRELQLVQPERASLTGIVTLDGVPLKGASVRFEMDDPNQDPQAQAAQEIISSRVSGLLDGLGGTKTDADGRFKLEGVELGSGAIVINHKSLTMAAREPVQVTEGTNERQIALVSTRMVGRVVDPAGRPVAGARVTVSKDTEGAAQVEAVISFGADTLGDFGIGGPSNRITTDQDGRFELNGIAANTDLAVSVESSSGVKRLTGLRAAPGSRKDLGTIQLEQTGSLVVAIPEGTAFAVVLATPIDAAGEPTGGPKIQVGRNGEARFKALRPGRYRVSREGNAEGSVEVTIQGGQESQARLDG